MPGRLIDGTYWPSVTEVIEACGLGLEIPGPPERRAYYLARGRALHAAIQYDLEGVLDPATVHPEIAPGLDAWRKFVADTGYLSEASEIELRHERWRFLGHPDTVGRLNGRRVLLDLKYNTVDLAYSALQHGGYALLWEANRAGETIDDYLVLQLKADGTYRLHPVTPDRQTLLACVVVHRARQARRRTEAP